jgi:hypothetical protein
MYPLPTALKLETRTYQNTFPIIPKDIPATSAESSVFKLSECGIPVNNV